MPSDAARMIEEDSLRPKSHWDIGLLKPVASASASDYGLQRMLWRLFLCGGVSWVVSVCRGRVVGRFRIPF